MQSILISSKDKILARREAEKFFRDLAIDKLDQTILEFEKAVGIPDIRNIQQNIYFSPLKGEVRSVLIDATLGITVEAQNALLKTLEDAPEKTLIILQVLNSDEVLPTIISRCKVIKISSQKKHVDTSKVLETLTKNGIGDRLRIAQDLSKDKNEALEFLESLIIDLRKDLMTNYEKIKEVQKFYTIIKSTNANLRLALENLFLSL